MTPLICELINPLDFNSVDADMSHVKMTVSLLEDLWYEPNICVLQLNL